MIHDLLSNQYLVTLAVGGLSWLVHRAFGKRADSKAANLTAALATASALMAQYCLTEPSKTPEQAIAAFKGIVAVQLAKAGIYEADRAKYQVLIDVAISAAVTQWVKAHPSPSALTMPITSRVGGVAA
jgi:hypothetical protein